MLLTCVTAVYNAISSGNRENLERCIESVNNISKSHEHLIYDGASTDETTVVLFELAEKYSGVRICSERDEGIYDALNKGVRDARGEWLYVLGCDDYLVSPDELELVICENSSADVILTPVETDNMSRLPLSWRELRTIFQGMACCHQGILIRTDLARKLGGFDCDFKIAADYDMIFRALLGNADVSVSDRIFAHFSLGGVSFSLERNRREASEVLSKIFSLTNDERELVEKKRVFPVRKLIPHLFGGNWILRNAAWHQILRGVAFRLGLLDAVGNPKKW